MLRDARFSRPKVDASLKSYALVMTEAASADARAADQEIRTGKYRGPLHGVPVAVKDLCCTKGARTMGGTAVLRNFVTSSSICLPSGFSKHGLPYSIQFAGRRLSEPMLCRIAHAYEQATTWFRRHPDLATA